MTVTPVPIGLLVSGFEPVKIIVFAMSFLDPHAIGLILMVIPCMLIVMPGVLVTTIIVSFFALLVPMVVLSQRRRRQKRNWSEQRSA
jgi:Flp pilus assembly protein TadB